VTPVLNGSQLLRLWVVERLVLFQLPEI